MIQAALPRIVVTSPSFTRNPTLRAELTALFPDARFAPGETVLSGQALLDHIGDAECALVGLEKITEALLEAKPNLRFIAKYGVGLDNIDQEACARHGVGIGWTGGVNARSVAEMTLCFMLGLPHNIFRASTLLRGGQWWKRGGVLMSERTIGLIGIGHVGQALLRLLAPFGCRILANDIADRTTVCAAYGAIACDKARLYAEADIVSLHVPLTDDTHHLINAQTLAAMKPGSFLINTARGPVVDQTALKTALATGHLGGAALDVFETEPPTDQEFLALPGLVPTPHIGGNAEEAVLAMGRSALSHIRRHYGLG